MAKWQLANRYGLGWMKILRPQKVGAEARLGDELNTGLFAFGAQDMLFAVEHQIALLGCAVQKLRSLQTQFLAYLGCGQLLLPIGALRTLVIVPAGGFGLAGDALQGNAHFIADADDALGFFVGVFVQLAILGALNQDAHLVVVDLAEFIEIQAGDDAHLFVHVALGVQVFAEAGADVGQAAQPFDFLWLQLALAIHDTHVNLEPVLVGQQLLHAVIEL